MGLLAGLLWLRLLLRRRLHSRRLALLPRLALLGRLLSLLTSHLTLRTATWLTLLRHSLHILRVHRARLSGTLPRLLLRLLLLLRSRLPWLLLVLSLLLLLGLLLLGLLLLLLSLLRLMLLLLLLLKSILLCH